MAYHLLWDEDDIDCEVVKKIDKSYKYEKMKKKRGKNPSIVICLNRIHLYIKKIKYFFKMKFYVKGIEILVTTIIYKKKKGLFDC